MRYWISPKTSHCYTLNLYEYYGLYKIKRNMFSTKLEMKVEYAN